MAVKMAGAAALCLVPAAAGDGKGQKSAFNCTTALLDACVRCYTDLDLEMSWVDGVQHSQSKVMRALIFTSLDPLVQCRKPVAYKDATECMIRHLETCSQPAETVMRLPEVHQLQEGMRLMCDKYADTDIECVKRADDRVSACSDAETLKLFQTMDISVLDYNPLICLAYEVNYDCLEKFLTKSCDSYTAKAHMEIGGTQCHEPALIQRTTQAERIGHDTSSFLSLPPVPPPPPVCLPSSRLLWSW
ncbi:hypothetical protein ACOMHN_019901 [Nucella lapillus]